MITPTSMLPQAASSSGTTTTNPIGLPNSQGLDTMFLQLLVAQLQNQSPLSPMDPSQFVGQLAQFTELSQVTQINQTLQQLADSGSSATGQSSSVNRPAQAHASSAPPLPTPSAAVSAAQAAIPNFISPSTSFLNHQIQGVF